MGAYGRSVREFFRHLVLEEGKTIVLASAIVGIHRNTGSAWLRQFRTEELLRENERLRQADDDRKQGLDRARAENDSLKEQLDEAREKHIFLCRDNAELKATIRRLRPRRSPLVRLVLAGLKWLGGVLGAGGVDELLGFFVDVREAPKVNS